MKLCRFSPRDLVLDAPVQVAITFAALIVAAVLMLGSPATALAANHAAPAPATDAGGSTKTKTPAKKVAPTEYEKAEREAKLDFSDDKDAAEKAEPPSKGAALLRMIVGLAFVIGVIYVVHRLLKSYNRSKFPGLSSSSQGSNAMIDIVATTPLSPTRMLHVVRVGGELMLIGATDSGISHLRNIDGHQMPFATTSADSERFKQSLSSALAGSTGPTAATAPFTGAAPQVPATQGQSFLQKVVTNLQMMTAR